MDDSCAVCADTLEWVAYGPCGHREVCSTCVARLRFICDDRRCCICKSDCNVVFVTKALGDYTRAVNDFSTFPAQVKEGKVENYWYHEDTQAFFDDAEHYKMIRAMCRLSCSICDKEEHPQHKRQRFRNIGQLKRHLSYDHGLRMCDLCLEGRKVFICEQKLYTRAQLNQHMKRGDSEVDGTESERGGFTGHPMCEFCRSSFYGENELYSHMSTEHFTCHICQRRNPGQYEYFKDYDDLETHFRHDHFLCEDEACLVKKFIVFQTEAELKRHNALEHGGRMSRSKRNAVLQIPTSFRYRSGNESSGHHRGRRRSFHRELSPDHELSMAIEASLDRVNTSHRVSGSSAASIAEPLSHVGADSSDIDSLLQPFDSLNASDSEPASRYRQAVSQTNVSLRESFFPPLSTAPSSSQQNSQQESQSTMAARLRRKNNATVLNVAQPRPAGNRGPAPSSSAGWPAPSAARVASAVPAPPTSSTRPASANATANTAAWPVPAAATSVAKPAPSLVPSSASGQIKPLNVSGSGSSSYARSLHAQPMAEPALGGGASWGSKNVGSSRMLNHSFSAPNLTESRSFDPVSDFPPVSAVQPNRTLNTNVQTANKSLVERMRAALDYDENKYSAFKEISQEYRQGLIGTWEYLDYVKQFELTHLVPDLARLCPDTQKQKELIEAYNVSCKSNGTQESSSSSKAKGKKVINAESHSSGVAIADNVIATLKNLHSQMTPSDGEIEVLEKDGYRHSKGKTTVAAGELNGSNELPPFQVTKSTTGNTSAETGSKQKKKTSKFHRIRLGDNSAAAVLDVRNSSNHNSAETTSSLPKPSEGSSAPNVWRNGSGQRLFGK
ncbi:uncharacterized protein LOC130798697 [Amaranthus tricolor]|uniref:uncharacterized protein LOC130798697 n=1 Tax=Amaranthus tricolor TaxID=29722 RepID=UPI0025870A69|nr:uncharacterized protein LOC130798697 [Amaranthus tricolor]